MRYLVPIIVMFLASCTKDEALKPKPFNAHKFIVAGHVYGTPGTIEVGIYSPFKQHFDNFNNDDSLEMVFFTGDVVYRQDSISWGAFMQDYNTLNKSKYIAPGNHDRGPMYESIFGKYYYSFVFENNLYIILTPTNWNIENDQLDFLSQTLNNNMQGDENCNNVFIFLHELVWWSPTNEFSGVNINSILHYPGSSNYESVIHDLLKSVNQPVYLFAGDLGAKASTSPFMKAQRDNVNFIATGMGGGNKVDNIIEVSIFAADSIRIKCLDINFGLKTIDEFDNYELP